MYYKVHPWYAGTRLNFLGFMPHTIPVIMPRWREAQMPTWALALLYLQRWFAPLPGQEALCSRGGSGRTCRPQQGQQAMGWVAKMGWEGKLSAMPSPEVPDMVHCDGRSFTHLPCTPKSAILHQRRLPTKLTASWLWDAEPPSSYPSAKALPILSHLERKMTIIQTDIKSLQTPVVGEQGLHTVVPLLVSL